MENVSKSVYGLQEMPVLGSLVPVLFLWYSFRSYLSTYY